MHRYLYRELGAPEDLRPGERLCLFEQDSGVVIDRGDGHLLYPRHRFVRLAERALPVRSRFRTRGH